MNLSIGISPCPNDTFIFDSLLNDEKYKDKYQWQVHLEDVETLNEWALAGKLDITKMSFATYYQVQDEYELLQVGSALGSGVGPLLVCKKENFSTESNIDFHNKKIAIPGVHTTANLLFTLAHPEAQDKVEMKFHLIEQAVLVGMVDYGLVIHESRFTYQERGLAKVMDMGAWWEEKYHLPIPLGCIAIRKSLATQWKESLEQDIKTSLQSSCDAYPILSQFVQCNAQEMSESVMRQHIELYVNEETMQLSNNGLKAIELLGSVG